MNLYKGMMVIIMDLRHVMSVNIFYDIGSIYELIDRYKSLFLLGSLVTWRYEIKRII